MISLPYVQKIRDRYGKCRYYYRRNQRVISRINGDPGSVDFTNNYARIHAACEDEGKPSDPAGTLGHLIATYYQSPEFTNNLRKSTQGEYRRHLEAARGGFKDVPGFGDIRLSGITKSGLIAWRNAMADKPTTANHHIDTIRALFTWAIGNEIM